MKVWLERSEKRILFGLPQQEGCFLMTWIYDTHSDIDEAAWGRPRDTWARLCTPSYCGPERAWPSEERPTR